MSCLRDRVRRGFWRLTWASLGRWSPIPLHGWRAFLLRCFGARIGRCNFIYPTARIWAPWLLTTGDVVTIGPEVEVYNPGGVLLESRAILSQGAFLCGATHDYNSPDFTLVKKPIRVGRSAWICARAIVLPGVTIGEGAVLGCAAVAGRDLPPWTVWAGNPALRVKDRTPH